MSHSGDDDGATFGSLIDLAAARLGGSVVAVTDEWFAGAANLMEPGRGVFIPGKFTPEGKWMDGWESRRKREADYDWCILKLGLPGVIHGVDVDTNHFLGNHPAMASLEACEAPAKATKKDLVAGKYPWVTLFPQGSLKRGSQNLFTVKSSKRFTHVRLNIFPDGGVARLRVFGEVAPDPKELTKKKLDLASVTTGAKVVAVNDHFFGPPVNMLMPGRAVNMGDGWETRRKRDRSEDWAVIRLGVRGTLSELEIDTNHFKGNFPESIALDGLKAGRTEPRFFAGETHKWTEVLPHFKLKGHTRHKVKGSQLTNKGPFTHIRARILPDGGISRLRLWGSKA